MSNRGDMGRDPVWRSFACAAFEAHRVGSVGRSNALYAAEAGALGEAEVAQGVQRHWAAMRRGLERRVARAQADATRRHPWPS